MIRYKLFAIIEIEAQSHNRLTLLLVNNDTFVWQTSVCNRIFPPSIFLFEPATWFKQLECRRKTGFR